MTTPPRKTHLLPRTTEGWIATIAFLGVFLLAMPPVTHRVLDQPDRWLFGVPVFFLSLLVIYAVLIGVLVFAWWKGL